MYDGYLQIANFEEAATNSQFTTYNSQLFIWDPTELVATRPLVWNSDNCTSVYTHDGNKNVSEVINSDDVTVAHYEYTPFGAVAKQYGDCAAVNPWRFSSEYADEVLGLICYNFRHVEPMVNRWLVRDMIGERGGVNLYGFVVNNCILWADYLGESLSVNACNNAIQQGVNNNKKIKNAINLLKKRSCPEPSPSCDCCSESQTAGYYSSGKVTVCYNNSDTGESIIETLAHELIHALDDCGSGINSCEDAACSEIRAYDYEGVCRVGGSHREPGQTYQECVKEAATSSLKEDPSCKANAGDIVNSVFRRCFGGALP